MELRLRSKTSREGPKTLGRAISRELITFPDAFSTFISGALAEVTTDMASS
jgi:hypothetical protein